jgi:hypothetical protein
MHVPPPVPVRSTAAAEDEDDDDDDDDDAGTGANGNKDSSGHTYTLKLTNTSTYNINSLLYKNVLGSDYYKACGALDDFNELLHEIHASVTHVEPWSQGTQRLPSTAFCLLVKMFEFRLTRKQVCVFEGHVLQCSSLL